MNTQSRYRCRRLRQFLAGFAGLRLTLHFAGPHPATVTGTVRVLGQRVTVTLAPDLCREYPLHFLAAVTHQKTGWTLYGRYCAVCRKALAPACRLCPTCGRDVKPKARFTCNA